MSYPPTLITLKGVSVLQRISFWIDSSINARFHSQGYSVIKKCLCFNLKMLPYIITSGFMFYLATVLPRMRRFNRCYIPRVTHCNAATFLRIEWLFHNKRLLPFYPRPALSFCYAPVCLLPPAL
ncbi:uncharacterized protein BDW43DRAFT_96213 [Aspergillus alliaceus]|uniref:uncharacterized protein n=1 Tax=Petromyces alliaceus TaxID=209559 RepID=UPI0012A76437|nr:uncharacterized protein BDW43DRAFT_96213 [Aspergillus alliaceus]KAB8233182.1 hypothetical protein BDW43DRAFT_96213 [Aspergillus alliaceus]